MVLERVLRRGFSAWAHAAAGLAISVIFGWLAIRDVSWGSVRASLEHIRAAWLIAALVLLAVAVVMRSERWRLLFPTGRRPPRLAVFCDGWQFHANPVINNVANDAKKRASLRAQGYLVLALTWQLANTP